VFAKQSNRTAETSYMKFNAEITNSKEHSNDMKLLLASGETDSTDRPTTEIFQLK